MIKLRDLIQDQIYRLQRISAPMSLVLLTLNLSLTTYNFVQWRTFSPYLAIPLTFLVITITILTASNLNIFLLKMHLHERRTVTKHNPHAIYAFTPRELMIQRTIQVPILRALGLYDEAGLLEKWNKLGYIPKEDYDSDLLNYYTDTGGKI